MNEGDRKPWIPITLIVGAVYCLIGFSFGVFASWSKSFQLVVAWRVASFVVSAIVFALHIGYEHFRFRHRAVSVALHTSLAVALGAFGLAVIANVHAFGVAQANHRMLALSLIIWPLMTGLPAFLVALITAAGLRLVQPQTG